MNTPESQEKPKQNGKELVLQAQKEIQQSVDLTRLALFKAKWELQEELHGDDDYTESLNMVVQESGNRLDKDDNVTGITWAELRDVFPDAKKLKDATEVLKKTGVITAEKDGATYRLKPAKAPVKQPTEEAA